MSDATRPSRRQVVVRILLLVAILVLVFLVVLPRVVDVQALGERIMELKKQLKQQFAGGQLPPPHTRSYSGHKLVQDKPVSAPAE